MVIIEKKTSKTGSIYYELTEPYTQMVRRWYPTKRLSRTHLLYLLEFMSTTLQTDALKARNGEAAYPSCPDHAPRLDPKEMTLHQYCEIIFMPRKSVRISENTRSCWTGRLNFRIYPELGFYKMAEITPSMLSDFLLDLQFYGLSCSTAIGYYTVLKAIFAMAHSRNDIPLNPMENVAKPTPRKDESISDGPARYSAETMAYIEECTKKEPLKWQAYIYTMSDTGIRRGECCGLLWKNVNFKKRQITIDGSLNYSKQKGIYRDTTKNRKMRVLNVSEHTTRLLSELWLLNEAGSKSEYVFSQEKTAQPMNPTSATRYFANFGKRYGVEKMHPHKLRHTFASVAIEAGADVASVSTILGHSNSSVTLDVYTQTDRSTLLRTHNTYREAIDAAKTV